MNANKPEWGHALGSDLEQIDAHVIQPEEYDELPELTDEMLANGEVVVDGYVASPSSHKLISFYLPVDVIERWKASGADWRSRIMDRLSELP